VKFVYYGFEDTDMLQQLGVFSNVKAFLTGRVSASAYANERFFDTPGFETISRFEDGATVNVEFQPWLQVSAGANSFKTENFEAKAGGYAAVYLAPFACLDFWGSFRSADPINDSYRAAREALAQDVYTAGVNFRPSRCVQASFQASDGEYSDGNSRHFALASLAWFLPLRFAPVLRLEYQFLDFAQHTPDYSSPDNYTLLRPVLELTPEITKWLSLEFHGELPYVFDEESWGSGITVGPRVRIGDSFTAGASYLHYEIPGGQTNWSGNGFKVDCSFRF
jgi:hypothetical protein